MTNKLTEIGQTTFDNAGKLRKPITNLELVSEIVKRNNTLTKHFNGSSRIRAVVYVSNPKEIVKLFDNQELDNLEFIMGHKRVHAFRQSLDFPTVQKLMDLRREGRLALFTSDKVHYHSKLYICESGQWCKMINGSANLTKTGTGVKGTQWNHIWIAKLGVGYSEHQFYISENEKFDEYKKNTEEFFGDFAEIFDNSPEHEREEITLHWIDSGQIFGLSEEVDIRSVTRMMVSEGMNPDTPNDQTVVSILPSAPMKTLRKLEENLASMGLQVENDGRVTIPRASILNHEHRHYPQLTLNLKHRKMLIGLNGKLVSRTADSVDSDQVDEALESLESYIKSILMADPDNEQLALRSVMEALLYILCSPFHTHYMRLRRSIFGFTEERGPRILHIWGGTSNGKSKLLNYASRLITGDAIINSLNGNEISMTEVKRHLGWNSVFPMMWDDLTNKKWSDHMENIAKNYWDKIWTNDDEFPQLIITSNRMCPRGPMQTRIKEVHFANTFDRNTETRKELNKHFQKENRIFEFFTRLYINHIIENPDDYQDDESYIGRKVMLELYDIAERKVPDWFPQTSLDDDYSPTAVNLVRALHLGICTPKRRHGELVLRFDESMKQETWALREYTEGIPNTFAMERKGLSIYFKRPEMAVPWILNAQKYYGKRLSWWMRIRLDFR